MSNKSFYYNNTAPRISNKEPLEGFEHVIYRKRHIFLDMLYTNYNLPSASSNDEVIEIFYPSK